MPRRMGRPGLMGTMARTAVIAGTATAVSGSVQRKGQEKAAAQAQAQQAQAAPAPVEAPVEAPAPADDPIAKIRELGQLKDEGLLSEEEFAAAKAKLLA
jgi:hypothetical protein